VDNCSFFACPVNSARSKMRLPQSQGRGGAVGGKGRSDVWLHEGAHCWRPTMDGERLRHWSWGRAYDTLADATMVAPNRAMTACVNPTERELVQLALAADCRRQAAYRRLALTILGLDVQSILSDPAAARRHDWMRRMPRPRGQEHPHFVGATR
jgi:hypothetical protein